MLNRLKHFTASYKVAQNKQKSLDYFVLRADNDCAREDGRRANGAVEVAELRPEGVVGEGFALLPERGLAGGGGEARDGGDPGEVLHEDGGDGGADEMIGAFGVEIVNEEGKVAHAEEEES